MALEMLTELRMIKVDYNKFRDIMREFIDKSITEIRKMKSTTRAKKKKKKSSRGQQHQQDRCQRSKWRTRYVSPCSPH